MIDRLIFCVITLAVVTLTSFVCRFINKRRRHKLLLSLRDRLENVYLVSMSPDGETPDVGKMQGHCQFVEHGEMQNRFNETMDLLRESGNRLFGPNRENVKDAIKINVLCFYFQDGANVNEDFVEYGQRVEFEVMADRADRHGKLKAENPEWYNCRWHGENVVEWEMKRPAK